MQFLAGPLPARRAVDFTMQSRSGDAAAVNAVGAASRP